MSDTILSGDVTVYYLDDTRQKRIEWTGSATGTRTVNELYSALNDLMDEAVQSDDGTVMSAETPVEYTVGIIDAGDLNPWYMTYEMAQHLTGGSIKTANWTRVETSNIGIVVVPVTSAGRTIVTADIGYNHTHGDGDSGTLLEIIDLGLTNDFLVIRPDTDTSGDSFDTGSGTITSGRGAFTATQAATSTTGEQIWANLYNVTPIEADTHVYMYQGTVDDDTRARIEDITTAGEDWWPEGAFDRLIYIRDFQTDTNPIIDEGYISVFGRKGNTLYDSFEVLTSTTSGGRNPVPLSASNDLNQTTGYWSTDVTGGTGTFTVGDEIQDDSTGARGIITQIDNPGATATYHFYTVGDPQLSFDGGSITNNDDTGAATGSSAETAEGPALAGWFTGGSAPTITHANTTFDTDDDATAEGYGITIDCNANPLTEVYEWLKYITRNGETGTTNTDDIEGEQYIGPTVYLNYGTDTVTGGTIGEGDDVTQETTGATGIVVSHDTTLKQILLRDTRGTFATGSSSDHTVTSNDNSGAVELETADSAIAETFNANKQSPFGTLAGGRFFGARGVLLTDYLAADENNFQLTDTEGNVKTRPQAYSITISNLVGTDETTATDDLATAFRLTGLAGSVAKTEYSAAGGESAGDPTLIVDAGITTDTPGKTGGGVLRIRDESDNNKEYRIRYDSWDTSTFTLSNFAAFTTTATTNTTQVTYSTGGFNAAVRRGDLVYNSTAAVVGYVVSVDSDTQLTTTLMTGQTNGDTVEINCVPIAVDTLDDVYVPLIDTYALSSTATVSIVVGSTIYYRVRVRNVRATTKIKTFVTDDAITAANRAVATIRNTDTIHTP